MIGIADSISVSPYVGHDRTKLQMTQISFHFGAPPRVHPQRNYILPIGSRVQNITKRHSLLPYSTAETTQEEQMISIFNSIPAEHRFKNHPYNPRLKAYCQ